LAKVSDIKQIGNTPLLRFATIATYLPQRARLDAKAEWLTPGDSVKDRAALNIIKYGELSGVLTRNKIILDISTEAAQAIARRLAREEDYLLGTCSGAALVGALHVREELAASGQSASGDALPP
jgi:cysteine synthase